MNEHLIVRVENNSAFIDYHEMKRKSISYAHGNLDEPSQGNQLVLLRLSSLTAGTRTALKEIFLFFREKKEKSMFSERNSCI